MTQQELYKYPNSSPFIFSMTPEEIYTYYKKQYPEASSFIFSYMLAIQGNLLPLSFVRIYKKEILWDTFTKKISLNIDFIREFKDYINWSYVCLNFKFTEDEIKEFDEYVIWKHIFRLQKITIDFVKIYIQHFDKVSLYRNDCFTRADKIKLGKLYRQYKEIF